MAIKFRLSKLIEAFSSSIPARRKVKGRDERHRAANAESDTPHMLAAGATRHARDPGISSNKTPTQ